MPAPSRTMAASYGIAAILRDGRLTPASSEADPKVPKDRKTLKKRVISVLL
jgi:hypothetical protein